MFSIGDINFANGVYSGNRVNGLEVAIMNSAEKADIIIDDFKKMYRPGLDPNSVIDEIYSSRNINENDLTDTDIERVNRKIRYIYNTTF